MSLLANRFNELRISGGSLENMDTLIQYIELVVGVSQHSVPACVMSRRRGFGNCRPSRKPNSNRNQRISVGLAASVVFSRADMTSLSDKMSMITGVPGAAMSTMRGTSESDEGKDPYG